MKNRTDERDEGEVSEKFFFLAQSQVQVRVDIYIYSQVCSLLCVYHILSVFSS